MCAVRLLACGPSGQPGGRLQLPVLVFCPSVLLTGPSIWASAGAVKQVEILSLRRCSDRRPRCCCWVVFFFLFNRRVFLKRDWHFNAQVRGCRSQVRPHGAGSVVPPRSDTWPLSSAPPSLTSFPYPLPLFSSRAETSGRAWT